MLKNATVLVTGAGKGIGRAFVQDLCGRSGEFPGLKLFLNSRTQSDLEAMKKVASDHGVTCQILPVDFTKDPKLLIETCVKTFGRLDVLVHSAGVGRFGEFLELNEEDLKFVLRNNVEASFLLMQAAYAQMKSQSPLEPLKRMRGQIQWITSVAADKPFLQSSIYCMSKFAQRGLIEVMRQYGYQDSIRILDIKPGATFTPMWGEIPVEMQQKMMSPVEIGILMTDALLLPESATLESFVIRPLQGDI